MIRIILSILSCFLVTPIALAERVELIKITADLYPGEQYTIGLITDAGGTPAKFFYSDPYQKEKSKQWLAFSPSDLNKPKTLVRVSKMGVTFEVVKLQVQGDFLTLYYKNDVRDNEWRLTQFKLLKTNSGWRAQDLVTNKIITTAHIETQYKDVTFCFVSLGWHEVGISQIILR